MKIRGKNREMSNGQKNDMVEANTVETNKSTGKVSMRKRGVIVVGATAVMAVVAVLICIGIYNTPANRISRQLDLGQRYLEEQSYEQAIVEFDKVIAIDPMNVDAYLGKAQAYEGMGNMEKAVETLQTGYEKTGDGKIKTQLVNTYLEQASGYVQSADYESALAVYDKLLDLDGENEQIQNSVGSCLEKYIEQLIAQGRYDEAEALIEKYRDKVQGVDFQTYLDEIGELKAAEFEEPLASIPSFGIADIKIMGYDLLGSHMEEIVGALGYSKIPDGDIELQDGVRESISNDGIVLLQYAGSSGNSTIWSSAWAYHEYDGESVLYIQKVNGQDTEASQIGMSRSNIPLTLGDSYEKWCDLLGVDFLRESPFTREEESSSFDERLNMNYIDRTYRMTVGGASIRYSENTYETDVRDGVVGQPYDYDYDMTADFWMDVEGENLESFSVMAFFLDGTVQRITYVFVWSSH